jgi:hypothetical protein
MAVQFIACLFAIATGIVLSAAIASFWTVVTEEPPHLGLLLEGGFFAPVKGLVVAVTAPTNLLQNGTGSMAEKPLVGSLLLIAGLTLSLTQGVFILNVCFGVS